MGKTLKGEGPATPEEVETADQASTEKHDRERLQAIRLGQQGTWTLERIGKMLGRGRATMGRWVKAYREGGLPGLLPREHGGREARVGESDREALREGLQAGRGKRAREGPRGLPQERGITLKLGGVAYWLEKVKARGKVPRKSHIKKNEAEAEQFKQAIGAPLEAGEVPEGPRVRIWVEEEPRYGLISLLRRCWTLRGWRPKAPYQTKYPWGYVYGAADVVTGDAEFLDTPTVSLAWSHGFLEQLVATDPEAIHVVRWDRAGFHPRAGDPDLPEAVRVIPFPAYSPELNPMEPLGDQVKARVANETWAPREAIEAAITEVLAPLWERVERVRSLLGDTWLTRGVAVFVAGRNSLISN